jgi:hypothetical protein
VKRWVPLVVVAACGPRAVDHVATPAEGIAIALYGKGDGRVYSVIDDRRWIEIADGKPLVLDNIDPGATLPSLMIESLGGGEIQVGACMRERVGVPRAEKPTDRKPRNTPPPPKVPPKLPDVDDKLATILRCDAKGRPGRYLVRLLYVSTTLGYRAEHEVSVTAPDRASITSRYAIASPAWNRAHADVALYDGIPGGDRPPTLVARGAIALDGSTSVIAVPTRQVSARLRRVYDGAVPTGADTPTSDPSWGSQSVASVWLWLELPGVQLASGAFRVHVELAVEGGRRETEVPSSARQQSDAGVRIPLWIDPDLRGYRQRTQIPGDGTGSTDRLVLSVANTGTVTREVWIEEHLRLARRRVIKGAFPKKPALRGDILRSHVEVKPAKVERVGYIVEYYDF